MKEAQGFQKAVQMIPKMEPRALRITEKSKKRALKKTPKIQHSKSGLPAPKMPQKRLVFRSQNTPKIITILQIPKMGQRDRPEPPR